MKQHFFQIKEKKKFSVFFDGFYYYVIAILLVSIYGGRACPFIDGISFMPVFTVLGLSFVLLYLLRCLVFSLNYKRILSSSNGLYFLFEISFYVVWGLIGTYWGITSWHFHAEGILKMLFATILPGVFFCIEMINTRERHLIYLKQQDEGIEITTNFVSLRRKILLFGALSISMAGVAIILVTYKNFIWTARNVASIPEAEVISSVLKETLFVIGTFLGLVIKLIINYSHNLSLYFNLLVKKLDQIAMGDYDERVPVFSHDEFSLLINHVNGISSELKEKQKIKSMFGKMVSPSIVTRIMEGDKLELGGFQDEVLVMFADIRNFTSYSEQNKPSDVIQNLNTFHTRMVEIILRHQGIIDKFLGDGLMAIFGVEGKGNISENAVAAAIEMHEVVKNEFSSTLNIGIGLHRGTAIVGLVGSPERLEFTVIGDTVNTASRIETATKQVGTEILISDAVYQHLDDSAQRHTWRSVGHLELKGKERRIEAFAYTSGLHTA